MNLELILTKKRKPVRALVQYLRFLLGKWSYEGVNSREQEELIQLSLWFLDITQGRKLGKLSSFACALLLKDLKQLLPNEKPRSGKRWICVSVTTRQLIPTPHQYFGWKNQTENQWYRNSVFQFHVMEKKRWPAQPFIGVGYKDKGTRKNVAQEGSPDWKTVWPTLRDRAGVLVSEASFDPLDPIKLRLNEECFEGTTVVL